MAATVTATVASVTPLRVHFPADAAGVTVPARNTSGATLTVGALVKVLVQQRGATPEVSGLFS